MPRYNTRFQVKKQAQKKEQEQAQVQQEAKEQEKEQQAQQQPKPNCICVLCSPARYEKNPSPQEEIVYINSMICSIEMATSTHSKVRILADLFEYIVAHPAIMSNSRFYNIAMLKILEFENDLNVIAYKNLLSSMEKLKKL